MEQIKANETEVICCGVLEKMNINWMIIDGGIKIMPFIKGEGMINYRINHCPSCGIYVRDCQIHPLKELTDKK